MKNILFTVLLLQAAGVYAQDAAIPTAPAAGNKYSAEIMTVMKDLSALLEHGAEIPAERMDALAPELKKFDGKVKDALGKELTAAMARREQEQQEKERAAAAVRALRDVRAALQAWFGEHGGKYPASLAELTPGKLPALPELWLPGHKKTAGVRLVDSKKYDKDLAGAVTDDGDWLYFSNPGSSSYGLLVLNCRHAGPDGQEFYKY